MNEVEKHYAVPAGDGAAAGGGAKDAVRARVGEARDKVGDAVESAKGAARDTYGKAADWGRDRVRTASRTVSEAERRASAHLGRGRSGVEAFVAENPVMVGVVGIAAGLLVGALLPSTRRENRAFGRYADEFRDQGIRYARELAEQGKHYVEESLERTKAEGRDGADPRAA